MSLTAAEVAEIMRLVEQSGFDEINLEIGDVRLHLKRSGAAGSAFTPVEHVQNSVIDKVPIALVLDSNIHEVTSPLLGTFYRAPKPGVSPFVAVGTSVEEDTIVAIIEVMKLMNTVRAGCRGIVTEILLMDGALAEYGQSLIRVRRVSE